MKKKKAPTLKALKAKAWKLCSEYVRRRYADEGGFCGCYTCGAPIHWKLEAQAGHAIGGRNNAVLLDVSILRPQCVACNVFRRGNYPVFTARLIRENGLEWFEQKLVEARKAVKVTRAEYENKIAEFMSKIEALA